MRGPVCSGVPLDIGGRDGAGVVWNNLGVVMPTADTTFPTYNPNDAKSIAGAQ